MDNDHDFLLYKIDGQGNILDTYTYGSTEYEEAHSIAPTNDGHFILCGHSSGIDSLHSVYLLKIDINGNTLIEKHYRGMAHDGGTDAAELSNGDLILVGETDSHHNGSKRAFWVRTDKNGVLLDSGSYGGDLSDKFSDVLITNNAYYMIGENKSLSADGNLDVYIVKVLE